MKIISLLEYTNSLIKTLKKSQPMVNNSDKERRDFFKYTLSTYEQLVEDIKVSIKFKIDKDTIIDSLTDTYENKEADKKDLAKYVKLPFPKILLQMSLHENHEYYFILKNKILDSGKEAISITPFWHVEDRDEKWDFFPPELDIYFEIKDDGDYLVSFGAEEKISGVPELVKYVKENTYFITGLCTTAGHSLILLNCYNIEYVDNAVHKTTKFKGRDKKKVVFTYKTLQIKSGDKTILKKGIDNNENEKRNSPKKHVRRGHYRKLASGVVVWVNHTVVGKEENGIVKKDYSIN